MSSIEPYPRRLMGGHFLWHLDLCLKNLTALRTIKLKAYSEVRINSNLRIMFAISVKVVLRFNFFNTSKCDEIQRFHGVSSSLFVWLESAAKSEDKRTEQEHGHLKCQ